MERHITSKCEALRAILYRYEVLDKKISHRNIEVVLLLMFMHNMPDE